MTTNVRNSVNVFMETLDHPLRNVYEYCESASNNISLDQLFITSLYKHALIQLAIEILKT